MIFSSLSRLSTRSHFLNWFLLAFLAGTVNAGGFLACQRFVTHVTGFASLFGVDFAQGNLGHGFAMLTVPLFFLGGAMISGLLIERRESQGRVPQYGLAVGIECVCLVSAALGGWLGYFGPWGEPLALQHDYTLLALLCTAMGIQNAVVTNLSGSVVRTTHLTGITTDLGVGIIRVLSPERRPEFIDREKRFNSLRVGIIVFFVLGSACGAVACSEFGYLGFLLPAAIALYAIVAAIKVWQKPGFRRSLEALISRG